MANFRPLNKYMIYVLDQLINRYHLVPPFLDAGCGTGHVSFHLLSKGWSGKAIDFSKNAVHLTKLKLKNFKNVEIEHKNIMTENNKFKTILMFDVLEHIKDDEQILKKACSLLEKGGYLVVASPSNPREWRWDDDYYGHYRRYTVNELKTKLKKAKMTPVVFWDYTFPFLWILRRIYTRFKKPIYKVSSQKETRTKKSSFSNAWDIPFISSILNSLVFLWWPLYIIQFVFFRNFTDMGEGVMVLAKK
jgi:2-polyprenyl-3-methyl-5-hydroxy-6-metoxy-1,4-benzoquinol methylase